MERTIETFTERVQGDLLEVEELMRKTADEINPNLIAAIDHLLASGGKRVRPILTLIAGAMLGAPRESSIMLAAAIEMLHTATLIHDDLIDGALLRRGNPTLNAQWSPGATVLTGDYVFARAAHLAAETGSLRLMKIFAEKLMIIVNGEITQLFGHSSGDLREDYFERIYAKTASLFEVAAQGPALLSDSGEDVAEEMKIFGYEVGIAFQIVDDILDFTGDQEKVGKPVANDLRQGILTLPTLRYIESTPDDPLLNNILKGHPYSREEFNGLLSRIRNSDAIIQALDEARSHARSAQGRLIKMPNGSDRDALHELAEYVVQRPL
jgi:geranylgeranyl pyrophosphate synthase